MSQKSNLNIPKFSKRRLMRGAVYILVAGAAWFAQQQGWLNKDTGSSQSVETRQSQEQSPASNQQTSNTQTQSSKKSVKVSGPKSVKNSKVEHDHELIYELYKTKQSDEMVTAVGRVAKILPDDNKGSRHQKFLMDYGRREWLLVAHNIDLAPYVPLEQGDAVIVHGEYEYNEKGGVLHWTHHDPRGYRKGDDAGYIQHNGKRYE